MMTPRKSIQLNKKSIPKLTDGCSLIEENLDNKSYFIFQHSKLQDAYSLNEEAWQLLSLIDGNKSIKDIIGRMQFFFDVEETILFDDMKNLLGRLKNLGLIEIAT